MQDKSSPVVRVSEGSEKSYTKNEASSRPLFGSAFGRWLGDLSQVTKELGEVAREHLTYRRHPESRAELPF